jgi:uncharacterized protein YbjT (DUF2867 family)
MFMEKNMIKTKVATVFGGTGFIGRAVVQRLAQAGYTVRIPTRDLVKAARLRTAGGVGQVVPMFCPTRNEEALKAVINGADVVINLIGILYESRFGKFQRVQGELPGKLATIAAAAGVSRFLQLSAIGANATSTAKYARTKAAGEAGVLAAFPAATILRPSIVFGPEDNFFNQFAKMAKVAPFLPLIGGGKTLFQPVYVGDVAAAVMAALTRNDTAGKVYELGGPEAMSFKQLMEKTLEWSGQKRCLMSIPYPLAKIKAAFLGLLPKPLLTLDQVELLKTDNVVSKDAVTLTHLGLTPTAMGSIVPEYLNRLRPGGQFGKAS